MADVSPSTPAELLKSFHERLGEHFAKLHCARQSLDPASPVFALEHDLEADDLDLLKATVRSAARSGLNTAHRRWWLPLVVYAAESGYDYVGDEYWRSFEQTTPGWRSDDRTWLKNWFHKFAQEYGGAVPTGAFAANFTIISWPITHAVLPTYLQRQLAQLLFEFSGALTSDLLDDPAQLGIRLARRASSYTERFRIFCENRTLVGQVAAALLSGTDEPTPYLTATTLQRIVDGLSQEQQARHWLRTAQRSASRVRGFRGQGTARARTESKTRSTATDPRLFLRHATTWCGYVELPDMTTLATEFPDVYRVLRGSRATVSGGARQVPPSGLLYPGQEVRLSNWPAPDQPFLRLEGADDRTNSILASRCFITKGPWWLFKRHGPGLALEVRGKFVRPGHDYVLIGREGAAPPAVPWCRQTATEVRGIRAYELTAPGQISESEEAALRGVGIAVISHVAIRPVGVVAAAWDGEGDVEWVAGEMALLGVHSDLLPRHCRVIIDGTTYLLDWAPNELELLIGLEGLAVGAHELQATLLGDNDRAMASGSLGITIRDPLIRPEGASVGEGIRLLPSPARPTLSELWDERAVLHIDGPLDTTAELHVTLLDDTGNSLVELRRSIRFPFDEQSWREHARAIRADQRFVASYDLAEACLVAVSRDGIGHATLHCERGFQPLRWRYSRRHDGRVTATLVDRTDGGATTVELYLAEEPLKAIRQPAGEPINAPARGGLAIARAGDATAAVILPTNPNEVLWLPPLEPAMPTFQRTPSDILRIARGHSLWVSADLPADAFAAHQLQVVGDAIARAIGALVGGSHWLHLEQRLAKAEDTADLLDDMQKAVGISKDHQTLASAVAYKLYQWLTPTDLLIGFDEVLRPHLRQAGIVDKPTASRFLLTLAGRPGYISEWDPAEASVLLERVLQSPVLYRAARFAVLGTRALNDAEGRARSF